jgi:hypothetical protein
MHEIPENLSDSGAGTVGFAGPVLVRMAAAANSPAAALPAATTGGLCWKTF